MQTETDLSKRRWFRHHQTGDLGFLIEKDGKPFIRLDRSGQAIDKPYSEDSNRWVEESLDRPFTLAQVSKVAFALDVAVCELIGLHVESKRQWIGLKDHERIAFIQDGPQGPPLRREMWQRAMEVLKRLAK